MDVDEIAEILGAETVAHLEAAVKAAFIAARGHPDSRAAEAALDRLMVMLLGAVIAHPNALDSASARADVLCRELVLVVAEAQRMARGSAGSPATVRV